MKAVIILLCSLVALPVIAACSRAVASGVLCVVVDNPAACDEMDAPGVVARFAEHVPGFDPTADLRVHPFEQTGDVEGFARSEREVYAVDARALVHELMHVHLWRCRGDPDSEHDDGVAWRVDEQVKDSL